MIENLPLSLALVGVLVGGCLHPKQPPAPEAIEVHGRILTEDAETLRTRLSPGAVSLENRTPMSGRYANSDCLKQGWGGSGLSVITPPAVGSVAAFETAGPRW